MKKLYFSVVVAFVLIVCGCNGGSKSSDEQAAALADTTLIDAPLAEQEVQEMVEAISEISSCLDSIQVQEQILFKTDESASKGEVLGRLRAFKSLLARKQSEIAQLTANNKSNKVAIANLQKMVKYLEQQLAEKAQRIAQLEEAVETKDGKISELMYDVKQLGGENEYLKDQNVEQDAQLNEVYYIVAEKKELKELGLLSGGGLSKKRANYGNIDKRCFTKKDKRGFKTLSIEAKNPKLITEKPESSYTLTKNDDGTTTLEITDAEAFWTASPYLIIQK